MAERNATSPPGVIDIVSICAPVHVYERKRLDSSLVDMMGKDG